MKKTCLKISGFDLLLRHCIVVRINSSRRNTHASESMITTVVVLFAYCAGRFWVLWWIITTLVSWGLQYLMWWVNMLAVVVVFCILWWITTT